MTQRNHRSRPTFHWQAILILLPLLILVVVGGCSLQQDRRLAEREAGDRARQLAELVFPRLLEMVEEWPERAMTAGGSDLRASSAATGSVVFQVSSCGDLLRPAPITLPVPNPLDTTSLSTEAAELWEVARIAESQQGDWVVAQSEYRQLLDSLPPEAFAAAAAIRLARIESRLGRQKESIRILKEVMRLNSSITLESGLAAQAVGALQWVQLVQSQHEAGSSVDSDVLDVVCSNAVNQPTVVSEPLLAAIAGLGVGSSYPQIKQWQARWGTDEQARRLHRASLPHLVTTGQKTVTGLMSDPQFSEIVRSASELREQDSVKAFWLTADGGAWLALPKWNSTERWIVCVPEMEVTKKIEALLRTVGHVPGYFGMGITLSSREYRLNPDADVRRGRWRSSMRFDVRSSPSMRRTPAAVPLDWLPEDAGNVQLASQTAFDALLGDVHVDVYLDQPSLLFARQRARTYWFGGLIATSAVAAMTGLVIGWRAFHQQRQLVEMQSRFVSSVSHELRAPIASMRLLAEGLESGRIRGADKQAEYFDLMSQQCRRLTALIENILDFSRIEQGRKLYEFESVDMVELVRQTVRLMEPLAAERGVRLSIGGGLEMNDCCHRIDGRALQQALVNLMDNAIKHAPAGSAVEVGIAYESLKTAAGERAELVGADRAVQIWVRDCGDGIPAAEHERIFEPFYRRGSELRRETIGIGIGLSIVRHVVQGHGGWVTVESEPGGGSKFILHVPILHSAQN